jgi:hypothetical protein
MILSKLKTIQGPHFLGCAEWQPIFVDLHREDLKEKEVRLNGFSCAPFQ